ncbi:phosphoglucomutase/phosphomannomutase family protein [Actinidia rufa]|uniref:Phosphoglucomutase/phosphomannomutase family protein n=1 Tax=Actinidia rufa TaxID=165716 RepID=A0A7J0DFC3_9ERIC|nr:phosphoglucomutase/phosphomannomutase family protein [Actinidia rufa]
MVMFKVARVDTTPFEGQKPGTSGLRKKLLNWICSVVAFQFT